jgi:hypothetical protein
MPRILNKIVIDEISAVDKPAQQHAKAVIMKRADDEYEDTLALAKALVVDGINHGATQEDFNAEIRKRADVSFPSHLSPQQRFTKFVTETAEGKLLFQAVLKAERVEQQAVQDLTPPQKASGPAGRRFNEMAYATARANAISLGAARSRIAGDPAHADLMRRYKEENERATRAVYDQRRPIWNAERQFSRDGKDSLGRSRGSARM